MADDIWFDPSIPIPEGIKNTRVKEKDFDDGELMDNAEDIDVQEDTPEDDDSILDEDAIDDELGVPGSFTIVSQSTRTLPDGTQLVDIVIDVEEVEGAENYQVRRN